MILKERNFLVLMQKKINWSFMCFGLILLISLIRVAGNYFNAMPLFYDEAQYWDWAQNLAFGYYSKPPFVAFGIAISTAIFGDAEWAVRLPSVVLHAANALIIFALARRFFSAQIAFFSALTYALFPAVSLSSGLASTDPWLIFFWLICWYAFVRAVFEPEKLFWWAIVGVAAGCGMLSKYSMILLLPAMLMFLLSRNKIKKIWRFPGVWLALSLALLAFLPNVIWNIQNDFVSVLHAKDNADAGQELKLRPEKALEFLSAQIGMGGPFLFVLLPILFWRGVKNWREISAIWFFPVVPILALILTISLLSRAHGNWAAPIYATLCIGFSAWALSFRAGKFILAASLMLNVFAAFMLLVGDPLLLKNGWVFSAKKTILAEKQLRDPYLRVRFVPELIEKIVALQQAEYKDLPILVDERKYAAWLRYYAKQLPVYKLQAKDFPGDHYDLLHGARETDYRNWLFVTPHENPTWVLGRFSRFEQVAVIEQKQHFDGVQRLYVYYVEHSFRADK
jgi:4-amino-4-deoxy-L-arabinose transferase-like glycosyltransferase